ncbi:MAG: 1-deoxy-D-xylulose-5-phosphate reductoisomerase [Treponema sp.]|jgi:1-deoxy-D-xylulose-5-phosphate reductoisomerase|nr:1-deoxy-D-xylulose-5-phosphate reductoisomerase [Treponema sp.]
MKKRVALLGATGSIGRSSLDVLRNGKDDFEVVLLSSHTDRAGLLGLAGEFPAAILALSGYPSPAEAPEAGGVSYYGARGLLRAIAAAGAEIVINGIAGAAGLEPSLAALNAGADLALANKETLVMAAPLVLALAEEKKARIIPVDSEHSAIFSLLEAHGKEKISELLLTASGGPFRKYTREQLAAAGPAEALAHPTWNMGPKITVDSASLANKGLEVIEAAGLFRIPAEMISVVVHPQSIVHSMVRLKDGAVYAQLSRPDMRLPIHSALYGSRCLPCPFGALGFDAPLSLEFERPDPERFPMLPLAYEAARLGGVYPAVYNAANEAAAAAFLSKAAGFLDIPRIVEYVLHRDWTSAHPSLTMGSILGADAEARKLALAFIEKYT